MIIRFVACLIFLPFVSFSQHLNESLSKIWKNENLSDSVRFGAIKRQYDASNSDLKENLILSDYHYKLAQKKKSDTQMLIALHQRAKCYYMLGNFPAANTTVQRELSLAKEANNIDYLFKSYLLAGAIAVEERKFLEAIRHFNTGSKICKENGIEEGEITFLNNLAAVYQLIGNHTLSLEYLNKAERRSNVINYKEQLGLIWLNKGTSNVDLGNVQLAISYFKKSLAFFKRKNDSYHMASCYYMLAECYHTLSQDDRASYYLTKSLKIDEGIDNDLRTLESKTLSGEIILKKDSNKALEIGLEILGEMDAGTPHDLRSGVFDLLYKTYKKLGNYEKSLEMHELLMSSKDSMRVEETNFAVIREAVKYEFELELFETKLKSEKEKSNLKITQVWRNILVVSISIIAIVTIIIFFRIKNIRMLKKRDELLNELKELKASKNSNLVMNTNAFALNRERIEASIDRKLNETDWKVLHILLDDPLITNKEIADKAFLSEDGIGSSLRRMYEYFDVKDTKYKKIALLMNSIKLGNEEVRSI